MHPQIPVVISRRPHPIPSRTRKLSSSEPMVLLRKLSGRVGRRRVLFKACKMNSCRLFFFHHQFFFDAVANPSYLAAEFASWRPSDRSPQASHGSQHNCCFIGLCSSVATLDERGFCSLENRPSRLRCCCSRHCRVVWPARAPSGHPGRRTLRRPRDHRRGSSLVAWRAAFGG